MIGVRPRIPAHDVLTVCSRRLTCPHTYRFHRMSLMTPIAIATILIIIINIPAELTAPRRHARKYVNRFSISVQYDRPLYQVVVVHVGTIFMVDERTLE